MIDKKSVSLCLISALLFSGASYAEGSSTDLERAGRSSWYVSGAAVGVIPTGAESRSIAGASIEADGKLSPGASVAVGRRIGKGWRAELELFYKRNTYEIDLRLGSNTIKNAAELDSDHLGVMTNVYYDFMSEERVSPYVMGGLGYAWSEFDLKVPYNGTTYDFKTSDMSSVAFQVGAGVSYRLTSHVDAFGGYRYVNIFSGILDQGAHDVVAGVRYNF